MNDLADLLESLTEEMRAQLLYLIDLPEHNTSITPTSNFFRDLAEQIIHREALKVFLRNKFSNP
jgi:Mg/Co/Ni transporter MgtE